jgi:photosystem II stability/assembly factor-like uncharacterized protein
MAIDPDPTNAGTLYAVTQNSISKSLDHGVSWSAENNGLPGNSIPALAIDTQNSSTVYAGVSGGGDFTGGVFKSTDGGMNWKRFAVPSGGGVEGLTIDSQDPSTLYAWNAQGLYRTTDGATSWNRIGPINYNSVLDLVVDPHNSSSIYGVSANGLVKSTDGGASWTSINSGLPTEGGVRSLAIDPQNGETLYAWNANYDKAGARLFKTTDGGVNWKEANFGLQGNLVVSLAIATQNASNLYAASTGYNASGKPVSAVFTSADGGAHWSLLVPGLPDQLSIHALAIDPHDAAQLYAATSGGTFEFTMVPTPTSK